MGHGGRKGLVISKNGTLLLELPAKTQTWLTKTLSIFGNFEKVKFFWWSPRWDLEKTCQTHSLTTFVYSCATPMKCIIGLQPLLSPVKILPYFCCYSPLARLPDPIFVCITRRRNVLFGVLHSPGQKQYSNTSPSCCEVIEFLVPFPLFRLIFWNTSPAHKVLYYTPPL